MRPPSPTTSCVPDPEALSAAICHHAGTAVSFVVEALHPHFTLLHGNRKDWPRETRILRRMVWEYMSLLKAITFQNVWCAKKSVSMSKAQSCLPPRPLWVGVWAGDPRSGVGGDLRKILCHSRDWWYLWIWLCAIYWIVPPTKLTLKARSHNATLSGDTSL